MRPLTLGTAGHIDHGKTALIEALTGKNTDRLEEERRRGISIELGYAQLALPNGRELSVIDVPGHEALVRTMVAGATGIDLFLMVVAADEGVMPQTREHLTVLQALGVETGVVALTRCDLADPAARRAAAATSRELIDVPLVEVSSRTGEGLEQLRAAVAEAAEHADRSHPDPVWEEPAVLHVDRVFTLHGIGTVVTGTLWSGELRAGQTVQVHPHGIDLRARSVQVHDSPVECARAGQRVALNLAGPRRELLSRGDVVASEGAELGPSYRLDVELAAPLPLAEDERRVQVHHGTRRSPARIVALDGDGLLQLRAESPLIARPGDRFVVRRIAPPETLGGGTVIDPRPARHGPGEAADRLRKMTSAAPEKLLRLALEEGPVPSDPRRWHGHPLLVWARRGWTPESCSEAIDDLRAGGAAIERNGTLVSAASVTEVPAPRPQVELGGREMLALELIRADGASPRSVSALAEQLGRPREDTMVSLDALVQAGRAIRVKPGVYYEAETLGELTARILPAASERGGQITLSEVKQLLGISRKYAQALLEHLDATHLTVRRGDHHVLRRAAREGAMTQG